MDEKIKIVEIRRGDEYRAKIESELRPGELFSSVYRHAEQSVREIIIQSDNFNKDRRFKERYGQSQTRGYGNNVIIFCGGRGEGKTSAMQSFSSYLSKEIKGDKLFGEYDDIAEKYDFDLVESIDPSMMGENDSITAALLSRLFYRFDNTLQTFREKGFSKDHLFYERNNILELFSKCYQDVNYFLDGKDKEFSEDNLELLAGMGSRIYMRDHLYKLVEKYLSFNSSDRKKFLVVQIDDADLFAGNVFKVCEEIRCFLALPNVIVLMACDFEQLTMAIDQQYYAKHKELKDFGYDTAIEDTCKDMSLKYLEKVLPEDRRIYIPRFRIGKKIGSRTCIMRIYADNKQRELFDDDVNDVICADMYEQLLRLIYNKTGMIIEKTDVPNAVLPQTFRELIQMMKVLLDMKNVDGYKIIEEKFSEEENKEKIHTENLRKNLKRFRYYFIDYWCKINLHMDEQNIIKKIYDSPEKIDDVIRFLVPNSDEVNYNVDDLMNLIKNKELRGKKIDNDRVKNKKLLDAIYMQITLVLNKRFLESALNNSSLEDLKSIMVSPNDTNIPDYHFDVDESVRPESDKIINFTNMFCCNLQVEKPAEVTEEKDTNPVEKKEEQEEGESPSKYMFDLWNPVLYLMDVFPDLRKNIATNGFLEPKQEMYKLFFDLKLIISNPGIRTCYKSKLQSLMKESLGNDLWDDRILGILKSFYSWQDKYNFLKIENSDFDSKKLRDYNYNDLEKIYLSNNDNIERYIIENEKYLKNIVSEIKSRFNEDGTIMMEKAENSGMFPKVFNVSDAYKGDNRIETLLKIRRHVLGLYTLSFIIDPNNDTGNNEWSRNKIETTMKIVSEINYIDLDKNGGSLICEVMEAGEKLSKYYENNKTNDNE